jgi:hypothetical protein
MRKQLIALTGVVLLASAGAAFAQSQQGGYLGLNPGTNVTVSHGIGTNSGSGQGGYLGLNPGANLTASAAATPAKGSGEGGYLGMIPGSTSGFVAPTDPAYSENGAPRAGAPAADDAYAPLGHRG